MEDKIVLKEFSVEQIDLLYRWANDPDCRKYSFQTEPISYETHVKWCYDKLKADDIVIYIAYMNNVPIGQLRLVYEKSKFLISYSIDKKFRGLGLGQQLIQAIEEYEIYNKYNVNELLGCVKNDNIASQKVFENCKYEKNKESNYLIYRKLIKK